MPDPLDQTDRLYLTGRIALVTGSPRGLGAAIAAGLTAAM